MCHTLLKISTSEQGTQCLTTKGLHKPNPSARLRSSVQAGVLFRSYFQKTVSSFVQSTVECSVQFQMPHAMCRCHVSGYQFSQEQLASAIQPSWFSGAGGTIALVLTPAASRATGMSTLFVMYSTAGPHACIGPCRTLAVLPAPNSCTGHSHDDCTRVALQ